MKGPRGEIVEQHKKTVERSGAIYEQTFTDYGVTHIYFTCPTTKSTFILEPAKLNYKNITKKITSGLITKIKYLERR